MASDSMTPPTGGGMKYGIIGVGLLVAAIAIIALLTCDGDKPEVAAPTPDAGLRPSTKLAEPELIIPEEEDAGPDADAEVVAEAPTMNTMRTVRTQWDCSGDLNSSAAASVISRNRRQVRSCYERALKTNHFLTGSINLRLRIGADGSVTGTQAGGSLRDPAVFACVRQLASQWRFPAPQGGNCAVISAPFSFSPRE
ncbi:MAG: AgmX/PglI C-terminal domain-containing protein [Myxococcota bacterium]